MGAATQKDFISQLGLIGAKKALDYDSLTRQVRQHFLVKSVVCCDHFPRENWIYRDGPIWSGKNTKTEWI